MKKLFTLGLMLIMGITAKAQEKVYFGNIKGDKYYIYPSTIQRYGSYLKMWSETQYAKPQIHQKKYYINAKGQWLIDCDGMKSGLITFIKYSKNGDVVSSVSRSDWQAERGLESRPPNSIGWDMIEAACKYYNNRY